MVAALPSLLASFIYDDVVMIVGNPAVHHLSASGKIWLSSYYPTWGMYRPLTVQLFAAEWSIGGGSPLLFHAVSVLLYAAVTVLVYRLARCLVGQPGALAAAAVFAVHPVHAEVLGNVVGQSELLAAVACLVAGERYLTWRREGAVGTGRRLALAGIYLLAIAAKEIGYVLPLLLAACEVALPGQEGGPRKRPRGVGSLFALLAVTGLAALLLRVIVLGGLAGGEPSAALAGLSRFERARAMLGVTPTWLRLLVWPWHLQGEYGPPGTPVTPVLGPLHALGAAIILGAGLLAVWSWRRAPVVWLGIIWIGVALAPVSNLLVPSGVIVAERSLFLPSVGLALVVGAGFSAVWAFDGERRGLAMLMTSALVLWVGAGAVRSAVRQSVWRSEAAFYGQLLQDAPEVYRAHLVAAIHYSNTPGDPRAEASARRALALYQGDPQVHETLGQMLRSQGRCAEAIPVLAQGVEADPTRTIVRSRLIECALVVGDTLRARGVAEEAVHRGMQEFELTLRRITPRDSML
jgi:hypothetical protein